MTPQLLSGLALSSWLFGVIHGCTQVGPAGWLIVIGIFYSHYYIKFPNSRHCEDIPQVGFFSLFHVSESCAFWTLCFASVTSCVFYSFTDPTMRWRSSGLSLFLLLSIFVLKSATELRICAYNVQKFDSAKASDERLMHYLKLVTHTLLCILYYIFFLLPLWMNYWQNWIWCCIYDSTYDLFSVCPCVCPGPDSLWYQPPTARGGSRRSSHWNVAVCAQQVNIRWKLWLQFKLSAWKSCQLSFSP